MSTRSVMPRTTWFVRLLALVAGLLLAGPASAQLFEVEPDSIDFGSVQVGDTVMRNLTVTNTGNQTITVQSVTPAGSGAFGFQVPGTFPIGPGLVWTLRVAFRPSAPGRFDGSVRIQIAGAPLTVVPLTGEGFRNQPRVRAFPNRLDFGGVRLTESATRSIQVINEGNETLRVLAIEPGSGLFHGGSRGRVPARPGCRARRRRHLPDRRRSGSLPRRFESGATIPCDPCSR